MDLSTEGRGEKIDKGGKEKINVGKASAMNGITSEMLKYRNVNILSGCFEYITQHGNKMRCRKILEKPALYGFIKGKGVRVIIITIRE